MSRIHDALKKAEAERNQAGTVGAQANSDGSRERNSETPDLAALLTKGFGAGVQGEGSPISSNDREPMNRDKVVEPVNASLNPATLTPSRELVACNAALLGQCVRFDATVYPHGMLPSDQEKYRVGAEEFRTLRSSLELVRKRHALKTILTTSPLPKEGKTFIAANLSQAMVWQRENRVLLIDGDLRLSRVHTCFGKLERAPGLADYLTEGVDPLSLIRRVGESNFFVLPAGRRVTNAIELIGNGRFKRLIEWLAPAFDWIVIDSPPCVPVSDARLIAEFCDGVLFVVRAGTTPSDLAKRAAGEFRGKRYLGVVFNGVDPKLTASSYYYGRDRNGAHRGRRT